MFDISARLLPLTDSSSSGCACCTPTPATGREADERTGERPGVGAVSFQVAGMTCSHCVSTVTAKLQALDGITGVSVDLVPDGSSTVTVTGTTAPPVMVRTAIEEAGYRITDADTPTTQKRES